MIRMKNSQNVDRHKNIFSDAFKKQKEDTFYKLDDYIVGKEAIEEKLKEIHINIERIGRLCDKKKKTSYEEYNCVMNFNKNKLNEDLNKYKAKLMNMLKNSSREDDIRRLQEDFMVKKLKVFDSNKFSNKNKLFQIEYKTVLKEKNIFSADILKVISDDLILINQTLNIIELMQIKQLNKIKILKQDKNKGFHKSFFNQSFFIYNEFVYSSLINLILCSNKNCFVTISNHDDEVYRIDTVIDTKFGVLENNVEKNIKTYEKEKYCLFYGDDKLYFFGKGDIEELTEDDNREYLILYGENLNIENSDEIILLYNGTTSEYNNVVFMNTLLGGFIRLTYY